MKEHKKTARVEMEKVLATETVEKIVLETKLFEKEAARKAEKRLEKKTGEEGKLQEEQKAETMSPNVVNLSNYASITFRGEGMANTCISAVDGRTNTVIVWRFPKNRATKEFTVTTERSVIEEFMERMIIPLLPSKYLVMPRTVHMRVEDVHELAKIPNLEMNSKVDELSELRSISSSQSRLPLSSIPEGVETIACLELLDVTCIPGSIALSNHSTITIEIKPKQGYFQHHDGIDMPYCNNCILQVEKSTGKKKSFDAMYDFCPLALFSTDVKEQKEAIESLIRDPHRNLRIFMDGKIVHSDKKKLERKDLEKALYPQGECSIGDLVDGILAALNGKSSDGGDEDSFLQKLLKGQKMDEVGIVKASKLFDSLSKEEQAEVERQGLNGGLSFLDDKSVEAQLVKFFVAATLKDVSIMLSLQFIENGTEGERDVIRLPSKKTFLYSLKVVDLDPKTKKNLTSYGRLIRGAEILKTIPSMRKPCVKQ